MTFATLDRTAKALWFPAAGECHLQEERLPDVGEGQVCVRTLFSGISRGTEQVVFNGRVPASEEGRMRGPNMGGDFGFPVKYGYAAVGRVDVGPADLAGRNVFCLHPHQDRFVVGADQVVPLPDGVSAGRAVLAANMETALNIVWDAGILPGDRIAIFGAGVVGALVAHTANQIPGSETLLIDPASERMALAERLGIVFAEPETVAGEFDVLVNASASGDALEMALDLAGYEARVVEASWYGEREVSIPLGRTFHSRRLSIISSQVGGIPSKRSSRWTYRRRMEKALDLLVDDRLDALISGETPFGEIQETYSKVLSDPNTLCHRINY